MIHRCKYKKASALRRLKQFELEIVLLCLFKTLEDVTSGIVIACSDGQFVESLCLQIGDKLPDVVLEEGTPQNKVKLRELAAGKKLVIVTTVGAFTPCCSKVNTSFYFPIVTLLGFFVVDTSTKLCVKL